MSDARIVTVVEPRHAGAHRLLLVRALEQVSAARLGRSVAVVDLDPAAVWTIADLSAAATELVRGVDGTVAAWLRAWLDGEEPPNLMELAFYDSTRRRVTIPGSLRLEDLGLRIGEGAARRGFMTTPAAHLLGGLAAVRADVEVIVLVCGAGLHPLARLALAVADATLVLVRPDAFVTTDMERVHEADLVALEHGEARFGLAGVSGIWFEPKDAGMLGPVRRGWARRGEVAHRVRLHGWTSGPPSKEILDQVQALNLLG